MELVALSRIESKAKVLIQSTSPYSEHFGETFQWSLIGIVSLYSEPLHIVNKMPLQIVYTIWRVETV